MTIQKSATNTYHEDSSSATIILVLEGFFEATGFYSLRNLFNNFKAISDTLTSYSLFSVGFYPDSTF